MLSPYIGANTVSPRARAGNGAGQFGPGPSVGQKNDFSRQVEFPYDAITLALFIYVFILTNLLLLGSGDSPGLFLASQAGTVPSPSTGSRQIFARISQLGCR